MNVEIISNKLLDKGLKVTPQRVAVLEGLIKLNNHPTAENIIDYIGKNHPHISVATVYKVLDTLVDNALIKKVKTERGAMRYDAVLEDHHHIYCSDSDRIEDYNNEELDAMLEEFFNKNDIPGFKIEDIRLQINGRFIN
ncbi:MAG: transcriptional repressor [Bacteroidales bacterium]|nr:transcriptional repressor [Bacteroidales bacterium]